MTSTMLARDRRAQSRARQYREASYGNDIKSSYEVIDSLEQLERDIHRARHDRALFSMGRSAFHNHGLDFHSRVLLCASMTGRWWRGRLYFADV